MSRDIAAIAAGLSSAQGTALQRLSTEWGLAPKDGWRRAGQACTNLTKAGLCESVDLTVRCKRPTMYRLTPFGLAVRAYLEGETK